MKLVLLICGCLAATMAQSQDQPFREDEMRLIAREFIQAVWRLGQQNKGKTLNTTEIEAEIDKFLQGKPVPGDDEKKSRDAQEMYLTRRQMTIGFARWLIDISSNAEEYAFTPSLSIKAATSKDSPIYENCVVWKISLQGFRESFTWLIVFENSERVEVNDIGQRIPKIIVVVPIPSNAPATAGARS